MGNLCPYWDGSLPILGADAGFAGNQRKLYGRERHEVRRIAWNTAVKRIICDVVEAVLATVRTNLGADSFALRVGGRGS
jgi:hypothetical protein